MRKPWSAYYKLEDLVERSGFDKRTIAYYVQESLLPRVGRRGPRTRYSEDFLDRLMFIRRVREMQDDGRLRAVTLSEIREVLERLLPEEIRALSREGVSAERIRALFEEPDLDTSEMAVPAEVIAEEFEISAPMAMRHWEDSRYVVRSARQRRAIHSRPPAQADDLRGLLREVDRRAREGTKRSRARTGERVTRVPISDEIYLSVRNIDESDERLVETLAEALREAGGLDGEE